MSFSIRILWNLTKLLKEHSIVEDSKILTSNCKRCNTRRNQLLMLVGFFEGYIGAHVTTEKNVQTQGTEINAPIQNLYNIRKNESRKELWQLIILLMSIDVTQCGLTIVSNVTLALLMNWLLMEQKSPLMTGKFAWQAHKLRSNT